MSQPKPYWRARSDKGVSYILTDINWDRVDARVTKMQHGFPVGHYLVVRGECGCKGYQYRGSCSHIDFMSALVDGDEVSMRAAKKICNAITKAQNLDKFEASVIAKGSIVRQLHIQASIPDLPEMRVVQWFSGLPVIVDINQDEKICGDREEE